MQRIRHWRAALNTWFEYWIAEPFGEIVASTVFVVFAIWIVFALFGLL